MLITSEQRARAIEMRKSGLSQRAIAEAIGSNIVTVRQVLKEAGFKHYKAKKYWTPENCAKLERCIKDGMNLRQISIEFDKTTDAVRQQTMLSYGTSNIKLIRAELKRKDDRND